MWPSIRDASIVLRRAVREARDDDVATVAQALAYSLFLAIPAGMLVALGVFSLVADERAVETLIEHARRVMPDEAATLLRDSLDRSTGSTGRGLAMTVGGVVLALWTTTSAATTLMTGVTAAFDRGDSRGFVRKRLHAILIVAALVAAAALVVSLLVLGPHLERWTGDATGRPALTAWLWWTMQWPILVAGLLVSFAVVLDVGAGPPRTRRRLITPGALAALVVWLLASIAFAAYSANFGSYDKTWGTLSAVIVTLVWLWLTSAALLFGAEIDAEAEKLALERLEAERRARSSAPTLHQRVLRCFGGSSLSTCRDAATPGSPERFRSRPVGI